MFAFERLHFGMKGRVGIEKINKLTDDIFEGAYYYPTSPPYSMARVTTAIFGNPVKVQI